MTDKSITITYNDGQGVQHTSTATIDRNATQADTNATAEAMCEDLMRKVKTVTGWERYYDTERCACGVGSVATEHARRCIRNPKNTNVIDQEG